MSRRVLFSVFLLTFFAHCTSSENQDSNTTSAQTPSTATPSKVSKNYNLQLDLSELVHLADVNHQGLFIDLGTSAQAKYTVGDWRSGWVHPNKKLSFPFSYAEKRARLYFHLDSPQQITAKIRLKPYKTKALTPYLNNKQQQSIFFDQPDAFKEYTFTLPATQTQKGENYLLLAFGGADKIQGEDISAAIDYIHLSPSTSSLPAETISAIRFNNLARKTQLGSDTRNAVSVPSGTTLEWYVDVPEKALLTFGVGATGASQVKVTVSSENGTNQTLFEGTTQNSWSDQSIDLSSLSKQIVRLRFSSSPLAMKEKGAKSATTSWSAPSIWVPKKKTQPIKPAKNLIVVLTDTLRADKLPPYNPKTRVQAPTIAKVAAEGAVFESSQSPENWTKPSVASVLTALHPITHQTKHDSSKLPDDALMLSEHLKNNSGFKTGGFVANGYVSDKFGFEQGWDYFTNYIRENRSREAKDVYKEAGDWIEKNKDKRFFAYIQTIDPHVPYDPPEKYRKLYDGTNYAGAVKPRMTAKLLEEAKQKKITFNPEDKKRLEALHDGEITQHDYFMGKFIERMKKLGLWENSVFVFVSDHGEEFNDHGSWGHGHSVYQELLGVPLIFHYNKAIAAGTRVYQAVSTMDLGPTALELLGVKPLPEPAEGRSLVGFMQGNVPYGPAAAFSDFLDDRRVIVANRWKLILRGNLTATVFNLKKDPEEKNQLELNANPVAERYLRILLGQFLGADGKYNWYKAEYGGPKPTKSKKLKSGDAEMDPTLKKQLQELGYGI